MTKFLPGVTTYIAVLAVIVFMLWLNWDRPPPPIPDLWHLFLA